MRFGWRRRWRRRLRWTAALAVVAALGFVTTPPGGDRLAPPNDEGVVLLDRDGQPLRATRASGGARQQWLPIDQIDPDLLIAFVASEDRRFFRHPGIDPLAVLRAARLNLGAGRVVSGASTITMQVARLIAPSDRDWVGKASQGLWALRLERHLEKSAILEQYLNRVPLGENAIGVEAAARLYFGASATELSLGQAALLAGLASAPSRVNPLREPDRAIRRRDRVLDRLGARGFASRDEIERARGEPALGTPVGRPFVAPHFTSWVLSRGERLGGSVRTSLDRALQQRLEAEVAHTVAQLHGYGVEEAALVVLDNRSGEVLAWVGSPDFFAEPRGQVDMVVSRRQPGSTLKPFLYGLAFDRGYTPATILADVATVYPTATGPYAPRNYDRRYRGPVRVREALGSSLNVPAVALANRIGVPPLLETLRRAGFSSLDRRADHYGLGLALGSGEVTLLELANGYRTLASGGVARPIRWRAGSEGSAADGVRVFSPEAAAQVIDILTDPAARFAGFGASTPLEFPFRVAAKTGTSRHFTDNWAVATTERFTVAVWVGNFTGRPMNGVSGVTGAAPLLQRSVLATAMRYPPGGLATPEDVALRPAAICRLSGLRAANGCPQLIEWFRPGSEPGPDTWFRADGLVLPPEYREWEGRALSGNAVAGAGIIEVATKEPTAAVRLRITSLRNGDRFRLVPGVEPAYQTVALRATAAGAGVRWSIDGVPHRGSRWRVETGRHRIRVDAGADSDEVWVEVVP